MLNESTTEHDCVKSLECGADVRPSKVLLKNFRLMLQQGLRQTIIMLNGMGSCALRLSKHCTMLQVLSTSFQMTRDISKTQLSHHLHLTHSYANLSGAVIVVVVVVVAFSRWEVVFCSVYFVFNLDNDLEKFLMWLEDTCMLSECWLLDRSSIQLYVSQRALQTLPNRSIRVSIDLPVLFPSLI